MTSQLQRIFTIKLTSKVLFSLLLSFLSIAFYFVLDINTSDAEIPVISEFSESNYDNSLETE